jgi:hypothetical protein
MAAAANNSQAAIRMMTSRRRRHWKKPMPREGAQRNVPGEQSGAQNPA